MTVRLTDFEEPLASREIRLRGKIVTIRAVSALESARVRTALPRPMAPMTTLSRKGSVATPLPFPQPDEGNEEWRRKHQEWLAECSIAEAAVGLEWVTTGGKAALEDPAKAVLELKQAFTDAELGSLSRTQDDLAASAEERALKNSSAPAMAAPSSGVPTAFSNSPEPTGSRGPSC